MSSAVHAEFSRPGNPPFSLPREARRSLRVYNLAFPLVFLLLLPGYFLRMFRRGNYREKFGQRFGFFAAADRAKFSRGKWHWLHSISVGETMLALKLAEVLRAREPEIFLVISVTTSTGFALAANARRSDLEVIYNPLDSPWIVRRVLALVQPVRVTFIEAIWPNLLAQLASAQIPTALVARLSPRSEQRFRRAKFWTGPLFRLLDLVTVAEVSDVARWVSLGVAAENLRVTGNVKFDGSGGSFSARLDFAALLAKIQRSPSTPVLLGGSTFPGEERILAELLLALRPEFPELFLILVPRHVERASEVFRDLTAFGLKVALRSKIADGAADVLLVDTTGELRDWYPFGTVVFMGKSLTAVGGQNPVEPVLAGRPVIFGLHMENFRAIVDPWLAADAAVQVAHFAELKLAAETLFRDREKRVRLASRAYEIIAPHQGATERLATVLTSDSARLNRSPAG